MSLSLLLFNIILEDLANVIRQEKKETKVTYTETEDIKLFLCADDRIIFVENLK